ncbi:hypothetical protein HDV05_006620 [Chytridiales sp. JEL 0842]|nr:hypothetical protein HDV05_006620 [Chytridiales sp. JEL 0842]
MVEATVTAISNNTPNIPNLDTHDSAPTFMNPSDLAMFESTGPDPAEEPQHPPLQVETIPNSSSSTTPSASHSTAPSPSRKPNRSNPLLGIPHFLTPQELEAHISAASMTILVRADLIETRIREEEEMMHREALKRGDGRTISSTMEAVVGGLDSSRGSATSTTTAKDNKSLTPASTLFRWPPYPVLGGISGDSRRETEDAVSPVSMGMFSPPPFGMQVPKDPRKEYAEALSHLSWGQYQKGLQLLTSLSSIGFMPAKMYFDPILSPSKNPTEWFHIASTLNANGQPRLAATWFRKSAQAGEPQSMLELAKFLVTGRGGSAASGKQPDEDDEGGEGADEGQAMVWFHRAWEKRGFADAAYAIGQLYAGGVDGDLDDEEEDGGGLGGSQVPWESVDPDLGSGKAVQRDMQKAVFWWMRAADLGHYGAQTALGEAKLVGADGFTAKPDQAVKWLKKAAKGGIPRAMFEVGLCLKMGIGCKRNIEAGTNWLRQAAEQGFSEGVAGTVGATSSVPNVSTFSRGHSNNQPAQPLKDVSLTNVKALKNGVELLRKSAESGSPMAMYVLGLCLKSGFGVHRNEEEGMEWLVKAAREGWDRWGGGGEVLEEKGGGKSEALESKEATEASATASGDTLLETAGQAWSLHPKDGESKISKVSPELIAAAEAAAKAATGGSALRRKSVSVTLNTPPAATSTQRKSTDTPRPPSLTLEAPREISRPPSPAPAPAKIEPLISIDAAPTPVTPPTATDGKSLDGARQPSSRPSSPSPTVIKDEPLISIHGKPVSPMKTDSKLDSTPSPTTAPATDEAVMISLAEPVKSAPSTKDQEALEMTEAFDTFGLNTDSHQTGIEGGAGMYPYPSAFEPQFSYVEVYADVGANMHVEVDD